MRHRNSKWTFFCAGIIGLSGWVQIGLSGLASPPNDNFSAATVISGTATNVLGSNVGATTEQDEPSHAGGSQGSVWWQWVAPVSGEVTIDTCGSAFDTTLAVYTGVTVSTLGQITANDDSMNAMSQSGCSFINDESEVVFDATEGITYNFAVSGFGTPGNISLTLVELLPNDDFANPKTLNIFDSGANIGATPEVGEPNHAGNTADASVWWTWTAPTNKNYELSLVDSDFDTTLAVYTGTTLNSLNEIASNDDFSGSETYSRVVFAATSGTVYRIAVDRKPSTPTGHISITIFEAAFVPPSNDNFSDREAISGFSSVTGSTVNAGAEAGEPQHVVPDAAFASVWWTWTSPITGNVDMDTFASDFNTQLAVYTGTELTNLTKIASNGDFGAGTQSKVTMNVLSNVIYQIAVDGDQITGPTNSTGTVVLAISEGPAGPANDHFLNSFGLSGLATNVAGDNMNATFELDEPNHDDPRLANSSVWWSWTAPKTAIVDIDTFGSSFDTILAVYTGTSLSGLTQIASNNKANGSNDQSQVRFAVQSGVTYHIAVDGHFGAEGNITLNIVGEIQSPGVTSFDSSTSNSFNVTWTSLDNETYEVLFSTNLVSWAPLTNLVSTAATSQIVIATPGLDPAFFAINLLL